MGRCSVREMELLSIWSVWSIDMECVEYLYGVCGVWSVEYGVCGLSIWSVWSIDMECVECGVWSVWSVEYGVCGLSIWSVWSIYMECEFIVYTHLLHGPYTHVHHFPMLSRER
jgi:hypothetical protein